MFPHAAVRWRLTNGPRRVPQAVSEDAEDEADGPVDLACLCGVEAAGEVAQPAGVDRDPGPEDGSLRASGSGGDYQPEQVTTH